MAGLSQDAKMARIERILADKEAGIPRSKTAAALGITAARLGDWISENMRHFPGFQSSRLTDEQRERRRQAYIDGMAAGEDMYAIAARAGCPATSMDTWLRENGGCYLGRPPYKVRRARQVTSHEPMHRASMTAPTKPRNCMTCGDVFKSEGAHNRMCARCRTTSSNAYSPYTPNPGGHPGRRVGGTRRV